MGADVEVVVEATYGWYWAVELFQEAGFRVHLSHPSCKDRGNRRVKNDERDASDLADLLRRGGLAEAWIAPQLGDVFVIRVELLGDLIEVYEHQITMLEAGIQHLVGARFSASICERWRRR